jgi:transcriptional regulator with XRE-family HTH domain
MHLVSSMMSRSRSSFYPKRRQLCNPYSLPYIFRKLLIDHNLTKAALAAKFGLSEGYVSEIESGSRFPSLRFCLLCANEFGANPEWVKVKYSNAAVSRYSDRLKKRLGV